MWRSSAWGWRGIVVIVPLARHRVACVQIEVVKVNIMLQIYANKWHVYTGLTILNPSMHVQINEFATSMMELFKLMLIWGGGGMLRRGGACQRGGDVSWCLCGAGHIQRGQWHV